MFDKLSRRKRHAQDPVAESPAPLVYVEGSLPHLDRAVLEQLWLARPDARIARAAGTASAIAEIQAGGGHAVTVVTSPSLADDDVIRLMAEARGLPTPVAIVPIAEAQRSARLFAAGADAVLLITGTILLNPEETLKNVVARATGTSPERSPEQSPDQEAHHAPAAHRHERSGWRKFPGFVSDLTSDWLTIDAEMNNETAPEGPTSAEDCERIKARLQAVLDARIRLESAVVAISTEPAVLDDSMAMPADGPFSAFGDDFTMSPTGLVTGLFASERAEDSAPLTGRTDEVSTDRRALGRDGA